MNLKTMLKTKFKNETFWSVENLGQT